MARRLRPGRIPTDWSAVTPEWMTAALAVRLPGVEVATVEVVTHDDGSNRRARFGCTYRAGDGPATVFAKAHAPAHRISHVRNGNLFIEARLFRSGVDLGLEHPLVYLAVVDRRHLDFLLVMEDVVARGADPRDATRPLTPDQAADGLRGLARLHSRFWNFTRRSEPRLRWMRTWAPTKGWQIGLRRRNPTGLERAGDAIPAEVARLSGDEVVDLWVRNVATLTTGPMTLLHSDAHIGNTYLLPDGSVGFLDWQVARRGHWSQDVGCFLVGALTVEDRRAHDRALVEEYRRALTVPDDDRPTAEDAWLRYRTSPAYGQAIWLSTLGTDGYQRRDVSLALAQRYATAFVDLDCLGALETVERA